MIDMTTGEFWAFILLGALITGIPMLAILHGLDVKLMDWIKGIIKARRTK